VSLPTVRIIARRTPAGLVCVVGALAALIVLGLPTLPAVGDPSMCSTTNRVVGALDTWAAVADHCPDPRVTIDGGPSGVTAADDASFTFHSPDGGTYFECSLGDALRSDLLDPTTDLAKLVTKDNPDCPNGPFQP
jgi:hypothetical protein